MPIHVFHFDHATWVKESTLRSLLRDVLDLDLAPLDLAHLRMLGMPHKHSLPNGYLYNPAACIDWLSTRRITHPTSDMNQEIA